MDAKDKRIAELEKRVAELEALLKAALEKIALLEKKFYQLLQTTLLRYSQI